ncbi:MULTISPECIES: SDR family oxidoreductase [Dermacoccus]|uniref:SDR family oxidoreductase n=1 Tax=Dermacoccus TaxID=57495 RepID=UPI00093F67F8|nr:MULTISPECIES: SDR family oxidoreductase [Dermacoccus]MBO1759064.1 SDR family oxidoreductase [Dermacoccus sp. NHGro5]NHC31979.1 SDR family oxidoreductase [Dermacoccus nishinomiyaensis]PZP01971.1 MAG: SDR family NAD(P)-dependent oxidoreductase [Dermacoccus nishinomiyaensis]QQY24948.1 SDR family oxidoreductase [Dermacoccus nishinomiyaensis]TCJ90388.1 putative NAD(P)-binding protein [Dermacoccus sp. SAI-028]
MRIAIAGGHGQIARLLGQRLSGEGHDVVGLIRTPEQADDLRAAGMEPAVISLEDASVDDVAEVINGCDAVVFAAGGGPESGRARKWSVDLMGAVLLADAAEQAGVRRYVMVSSIGSDAPENVDAGVFQVYLYAKGGADADLRTRDLDWTIVRPGMLTDDAPTGQVTINPDQQRQPITRGDVAHTLAQVLTSGHAIRETFVVVNGTTPVDEAVASL